MTSLTARDVMSSPVVTVTLDTTVQIVAQKLSEEGISGLVVVDSEGKAAGMLTNSDLLHRVAHPHLPPQVNILGSIFFLDSPAHMEQMLNKVTGTTAKDIMSGKLVSGAPEESVRDLADRMLEHKVGRIPILERGRPIGMVTRRDLVSRVVASGQVP